MAATATNPVASLVPPASTLAPTASTETAPSANPPTSLVPATQTSSAAPAATPPANPAIAPAPNSTAAPAPPAATVPANPPTTTPATPVPSSGTTPSSAIPGTSIQDNLDSMLKSGSPYLELAKTQSQEQAASRGLQNSSIAAGAGEAAAIAAAAPIATAQAQLTQQAALQKEGEQAQIQNILTQGDVNAKLQASQDAFEKMINDVNNGHQITMANLNFQNQMKLVASQGSIDIEKIKTQTQGAIDGINAQAVANASQDGPALQSQYLTQVATLMQANTQAITQIYSTQGLTSAQQQAAVATQNQILQQNLKNLAAYYASSPLWLTGQNPAPIPGSRGPTGLANPPAAVPSLVPPTNPGTGTTPTNVNPGARR